MLSWPKFLVQEIAARRCIFFLGSGVSASAGAADGSSPKDWKNFILSATKLIADKEKKSIVSGYINEKNYLLALQGIKKGVDGGDYYILLNKHFNNSSYEPSELHKIIFDLDVRIVITTNFDKIYEKYCHKQSSEGYKTIHYDSTSLLDDIRSDDRLAIKAHGSTDNINKMIFTKSQYHKAKRDYPNFYEVLKALFITNTVLFIGCGLYDPDISLLLEEVNIIGSPAKPHYALIREGDHNNIAVDDWRETYNISVLEYGPDYENLANELRLLFKMVDSERMTRSPS